MGRVDRKTTRAVGRVAAWVGASVGARVAGWPTRWGAAWVAGLVAALAFGLWAWTRPGDRLAFAVRGGTLDALDLDALERRGLAGSPAASSEASNGTIEPHPPADGRGEGPVGPERSRVGRLETSLSEEQAEPSRALLRVAFESAVAAHFPDRRLSSDEIERVTDSLMELRIAKQALQGLPNDVEHAEQRRLLVERIGEASSTFRDVMDITPSEFTASVEPGLDHHDADEVVPEPEWLDRGR